MSKRVRAKRTVKAAATCGVAVALSLTYSSPVSAATSPEGMTVGGPRVDLALASGDAPVVDPGMYATSLPNDTTERYIRVKHAPGGRVQVGLAGAAMWQDKQWFVSDASTTLNLKMATPDGTYCDSSNVMFDGASTAPGFVSTDVSLDEKGAKRQYSDPAPECTKADELVVSIKRDITGDKNTEMPAQLVVTRVPAVANPPAPPKVEGLQAPDTTPLNPQNTLEPGRGYYDAPALKPGGYSVKNVPGRVMFARVYLHEGQQLAVSWQLPTNGKPFKPSKDLRAFVGLASPSFQDLSGVTEGKDNTTLTANSSNSSPEVLSAYTEPVHYANAHLDSSIPHSKTRWATDPGWYYVLLMISPTTLENDVDIPDVETTLSVRVLGDPQPSTAQQDAPKPDAISGDGGVAGVMGWVGSILSGLAVAAVGAWAFWRYRRHQRQAR